MLRAFYLLLCVVIIILLTITGCRSKNYSIGEDASTKLEDISSCNNSTAGENLVLSSNSYEATNKGDNIASIKFIFSMLNPDNPPIYTISELVEGSLMDDYYYTLHSNGSTTKINIRNGEHNRIFSSDSEIFLKPIEGGYIYFDVDCMIEKDINLTNRKIFSYPMELKKHISLYGYQELSIDISESQKFILFANQIGDSATPFQKGINLYNLTTQNTKTVLPDNYYYYYPRFVDHDKFIYTQRTKGNNKESILYDIKDSTLIVLNDLYKLGGFIKNYEHYLVFENGFYNTETGIFTVVERSSNYIVDLTGSVYYFIQGNLKKYNPVSKIELNCGFHTEAQDIKWISPSKDGTLLVVFLSDFNGNSKESGIYTITIKSQLPISTK